MFVTGCHRSGTSLLSSLLQNAWTQSALGEEDTLERKLENPKGFFESKRLVSLNDELLTWINSSWKNPPLITPNWNQSSFIQSFEPIREDFKDYALRKDWIDKDPRLCITYSAYIHIFLKRVPLLAILRKPLEVATSLYARNGINLNGGLALWYLYNHHLSSSIHANDLLLFYEDILQLNDLNLVDKFLANIVDYFALNGYKKPNNDNWKNVVSSSISKSLNRSVESLPLNSYNKINNILIEKCESAYSLVANSSCKIETYKECFDDLHRVVLLALQQYNLTAGNLASNNPSNLSFYSQSLNNANVKVSKLESELLEIKKSTSWKLTKPFRYLKDLLFVRK